MNLSNLSSQKTVVFNSTCSLFSFHKIFFFTVCMVFFSVNSVYSQEISADKVVMNANDLKNGYIYVKVPFYNDDGWDEGITPTDLRAGRIIVNDYTILRFWSFKGAGDPQSSGDYYWIRSHRSLSDATVYIYKTDGTDYWDNISSYSTSYDSLNYDETKITKDGKTAWAEIRVCLPAYILDDGTIQVQINYYVDRNGIADYGATGTSASFSGLTFPIPSLSESFSSTSGKYDIGVNVSPTGVYQNYEYSIDGTTFSTLIGSTATIPVNIADTAQTKTVYIRYTMGYCNKTKDTTNTITLPAYPQPRNLTASDTTNGNTNLSWKISLADAPRQEGDQFEIERADNINFANPVLVTKVDFDPTDSTYTYFDETGKLNINGQIWYRIRRTKTSSQWGWNVCNTTSITKSMHHTYISNANVSLSPDNITKTTWNYDGGNIWTTGTTVVIERYNLTTGGAKEVITVPADSMVNRSYSEELFQMCNKFQYKIYVKPGNLSYTTQEPIIAQGENIVPMQGGNILSVNASKGYYSTRTELSWETDGMPIDFFSIKNRIYQSGQEFKQIDQVTGTAGSKLYLYNDEQSNPGEIYEYQIIGTVQCADVTTTTDTFYTYGFRTPTGDIYGRVTFQNGQAVENVEVRLESDDGIPGKSMQLTTPQVATINDTSFLKTNIDSITIQAWVSPDGMSGTQKIFTKPGMYELGIINNYFYFTVGGQTLTSLSAVSSFLGGSGFVHVTGVSSANKLSLYLNGVLNKEVNRTAVLTGNENQATMGSDFAGAIDEVRIWSRPLSATEIKRDYNRYITGGESGLLAYWSFNYGTTTEFYDRSYKVSTYNENHGNFNGATLNNIRIPTNEQLGYKGVTSVDGSYEIRAIPYIGNGTVYTIIPRLGIHQFESQEEVRFIGEGSQSHTVNFTDKSSFKVTGSITYDGGTIPVQGVSFTIDGVVAMGSNGTILMTNAQGEFEIQVPVGSHEVIATKANHQFENGGKITNSYGVNLNYQDEVLGLRLKDITTIKYIGRVAGGAIQDAYPLGLSLSKNNLADGITVTLTTKNPAYKISNTDRTESFNHLIPSNKGGNGWPKTNNVKYGAETITIYPNIETGEFIAEVIPETFTVRVNVPGHDDIPGSGEDLNLTQKLILDAKIYQYTDSTKVGEDWVKTTYTDTVFFHASQKFIKRYSPTVRISQIDNSMKTLPYFGDTAYVLKRIGYDDIVVDLYPNGSYLLGKPVFRQNDNYTFKAEVYEKYTYYAIDGNPKTGSEVDEVPTQDATIQFTNNLSVTGISEVEADSVGVALYNFQVREPELTSAIRAVSAKIYYGNSENRTSINWNGAFTGIILGAVQTGRDFVTGGPDKVLMVLRDPPGSNSYSFLEKGISIKESSQYRGSVKNTGSESLKLDLGTELITFTGIGVGTIQSVVTKSGNTLGIVHEETVGGSNKSESVTTTTTRFQTSSDPLYVGSNADVFVGYSTNIAYGSTENVSIIPRSSYQANTSKYVVYTSITPVSSSYLLVKQTGLGLSQSFGTLFAFPQSHIVERLLPEMEALRNNFLMQQSEVPISTLQTIANDQDTVFYVSYLTPEDPNYGKSNSDEVFDNASDPDINDVFNGASYRVIFPERNDFTRSDTILFINQSIANWHKQLAANEEAKINAKLLQNYSFEGGSPVSYSESFSSTKSNTVNFDIMIGGNFKMETGVTIMGFGFNLAVDETINTTHGGEFVDEDTQNHSKGFVLDDNYGNYLSVDVMYEDAELVLDSLNPHDDFYPTFIFRTQAGATSCPYEGENATKYFEPGQHIIDQATKKIEVPEIAVEKDFIENVPSGESAYFTLYLRNNSEIKQENWVTIKIVEESNPNGAKLSIDGGSIGNGKDFIIPAGGTLIKTLEVGKGSVLNYDNLQIILQSQCDYTLGDTVAFTVHFTPSCSPVEIEKPSDKWTYNTKLPTVTVEGIDLHYMDVRISGFDVNYDSFNHIKLQYKSASESDDGWKTLMKFYSDSVLYLDALEKGNASFIDPNNAGTIKYVLKMDDLPDQKYDLRAVSVCLINNEEIENISGIVSGIKDMLRPRLFGSPKPANGILTIEDDIRLNFNEQIAEGLLTKNNFQVTGIRNGAKTDHSVSIRLDGINDYMETEFDKNMANKDITVEMWIKTDSLQDATLFSHGNINESIEIGLTLDKHLRLNVGNNMVTSQNTVPFEAGSWAHIALVYNKEGTISAYYNFTEVISNVNVGNYTGIGNFVLGKDISDNAYFFKGFMHNVRIWNKLRSSGEIQVSSLAQLSGNEPGLLAYYPMTEAKGTLAKDKARGANMIMNGCSWALPDGKAIILNGTNSYVKINTGSSAVIKSSMDFTIELWFKGEPGQTNTTLFSNGRGDGLDMGGSSDLFSIEFNSNGKLRFVNNTFHSTLDADYLDNQWHHIAVNVNRTIGRGQIYMDGHLMNYFDSNLIGGIASSSMYIGARAWYAEGAANTLNIDNFFKGEIDELRIWNLYKNEQLINENNNVKLDGTEMGLLAYYPFEYYKVYQGRPELDFTLADMKVQRDIVNAVPDAENKNAVQTSDIPPVKDKGPVSNLEFDFVVNNDALIIYLAESWEKIEKTIVTFTVDGIQDVNGNENISPITWSAYIDRNQLKWSETEINISKPVNEPLEFSVKALNLGGSIQHFNIENMPSWMEITPMSGSINPSSSININFVIDEGLNIGTYNEVIYMRNDNNVTEALDINIIVKGEKPDWQVDPANFEHNMSIFGKMRFNNIFSADKEDMLAAFNEGKCIGVTTSSYIRDMDMWYALLTVYSNNNQSNKIEFRIWDASTGIIYMANPGMEINFVNDAVVGTPNNLIIFDAHDIVYQNIALVPGWNWISFNVETDALGDLNQTLADMNWNSSNYFKSEFESVSANYSVNENKWIFEGPPLTLNHLLMYKISSSINQTISLAGNSILPSSISIPVKGNLWNYISYLPNVRLPITEALAGYEAKTEDVIKSQNGFAMYSESIGWLGSLTYMEPNKGFMLYRNDASDVSFYYPNNHSLMNTKSNLINDPDTDYINNNYSGNMNLIATSDIEPQATDRIFAYIGNTLSSGTGIKNVDGKNLYFITVMGDENMPVSFVLERDGEIIGTSTQKISFSNNLVCGTIANPITLNFNQIDPTIRIYPNPISDYVTISFIAKSTSRINISIIDVTGRQLINQVGTSVVNGFFNARINCSHLIPGLYFVNITVDGVRYIHKIGKQ